MRPQDWFVVLVVAMGFLAAVALVCAVALSLIASYRRDDRGSGFDREAGAFMAGPAGRERLGVTRQMLDERRARCELRPRSGLVQPLGADVIDLDEYRGGRGAA